MLLNLVSTLLWEDHLYNLYELRSFNVKSNYLTGQLSPQIGNLINLEYLYLDNNEFYGNIPPEIGYLQNLRYLLLDKNNLTGNIPAEIGNLTYLTNLCLFKNELSGELPIEIGNLENLQSLMLYSNQLSGELPESIGNLTNLHSLIIYNNQFSGHLPSTIGNLENLYTMHLYDNNFSGEIPSDLWGLNIQSLAIYNNHFEFSKNIGENFDSWSWGQSAKRLNLQYGTDNPDLNYGYGNNLVSFSYLSHDTYRHSVFLFFNRPPKFLVGQGLGVFQVNGSNEWDDNVGYSGNLSIININSGYWLNLQESQETFSILEFDNSDLVYHLDYGNNLISYSKKEAMSTLELPTELLEVANFILGQGQGLFKNSNGEWSGNLTQLVPNRGYWINVNQPISFQYPPNTTPVEKKFQSFDIYSGIPNEFQIIQSTEQSFYLIKDIELNNKNLVPNEFIVLSFNNDKLTGSGLYTGKNSTLVTMGQDMTNGTEQFHSIGDTPSFKLYCKSTGEIIPLYGSVPSWTSNNFQEIELLQGDENYIPEKYEFGVSIYPNPFNPNTTINITIPESNYTEIDVYNIQGKIIKSIFGNNLSKGSHQFDFNGENLSSGTYFIQINSGQNTEIRKVLLIK